MDIVIVDRGSPAGYFQDIARLHETELQAGLLAKLGVAFLSDFYRYIASDPECILLAALEGERVKGFVSGTSDMAGFYRRYLRRRGFKLVLPLAAYVLRRRSFPSIATFGRYLGSRGGDDLPAAELTSLAVELGTKRRGIGKLLFAALREHFRLRGLAAFKVTTATTQLAALHFYPAVGARIAGRTRLGELESIVFYCPTTISPASPDKSLITA